MKEQKLDQMQNERGESMEGPTPEQLEQRIRKVQIIALVIVGISAVSLVASMMVYDIPLNFALAAVLVGGLMAVGMSYRRNHKSSIVEGILFGIIFGSFAVLREWLFPEMTDDFIVNFWSGMSAWALGFSLVSLPLLRRTHERQRNEIRDHLSSVQRNRERGDGPFVAQFRVSAKQMGRARIITMIIMGGVMVGFGLFAWLFMDLFIGLVLALMMSVPVVFFSWMLKLRRD